MTATASGIEAQLGEARHLSENVIDGYFLDRSPSRWLWQPAAEYPGRGGKAIRPALCIAACRAFGGQRDEALPSAAAIELLHNAFLVHDDIEDESTLRRGAPTLHELYGVPIALNAGDAMVLGALDLLRPNREVLGARMAERIVAEFDLTLRHTVEGQAIELGWRRDLVTTLGPEDYLDMIMRKTCWYTTIHPLRVGALIGTRNGVDLDPLVHFGTVLGAAFQIQDDLLNLVGDDHDYGKEAFGDLLEGKRTLMLIHLLDALGGEERRWLVDQYLVAPRAERTIGEAERILQRMHDHGSIVFAQTFAEGIRVTAADSFEQAFSSVPESPDKRFLRAMIDFMLDRTT